MNWVDLVIILVLLFFASEAWRIGLWIILADFLSFLFSLLLAMRGYGLVASLLESEFSLSSAVAKALGFLITALVSEALLGIVFTRLILRIPNNLRINRANRILAIIPALGEGLVLMSFVLTLLMGIPVAPTIKEDVAASKIGGAILQQTSGVESRLNEIFGGVVEDALTYFTVKPDSHESVPLEVESYRLQVDEKSEREMFAMVNEERRKAGVGELTWAPDIVPVGRAHATDMWERKYFSHVSPDGKDVGDRLEEHKVKYQLAGENLALAPTLQTAHTGLMNSQGHRENILEKRFKKIGIGVIDNGYYGKMFVQVFTD
jgi:uncharacterized protein YkwD/uncharacterized membrane protein required for colicin V production